MKWPNYNLIEEQRLSGTWVEQKNNRIGKIIITTDLLGDSIIIVIRENTRTKYTDMTTTVSDDGWASLFEKAEHQIRKWEIQGYKRVE